MHASSVGMIMRSLKTKSYILVTPAKNEEDNLPLLAKSVVNQTIRPKLWVIVNDNSTDGTGEIISYLESKYPWILGVHLQDSDGKYDPVFRNSVTYRAGLRVALNYMKNNALPFGYIGIVDADFILERKFFEKLLNVMGRSPKLGIVSGGVYIKKKGKLVWERSNPKFPRGSPRLIRFECFFDIGGYPFEPAPDLISYYLARIKGWDTLQVVDAISVELRATGSRGNVFKRYKKQGFVNYYIGVPLLSEILYGIYISVFHDPKRGIGLLVGYLESFGKKRIKKKYVQEFLRYDFTLSSLISKGISQETLSLRNTIVKQN